MPVAASTARTSILEIYCLMAVSVGGYGEQVVAAVLHAIAHVIGDAVIEYIHLEKAVLMGCSTEHQTG